MNITIHFTHSTVKALTDQFQVALRRGDQRLIKRIAALLFLAAGFQVSRAAARVGVSEATMYGWLHAFVRERCASLHYRTPPGRPSKLTPAQKRRLCALVEAGPETAGYRTGCWNSALIQGLIQPEVGVLDNVHYGADLLRNLGFSYQKARLVSDHLNEEQRQAWRQETWPALVQAARRTGALLRFGDEASFAQWGSLAYTWARRGQQPLVKTGGKRKGYKVFGLSDYFTGRLFSRGQTGRFNAAS